MSTCCVPTCPKTHHVLHKFPRPDKLRAWKTLVFKIWLYRACNEIIEDEEGMETVLKNYRICSAHFSDSCKLPPYHKLKRGSLPTLFLPNFSEESNEINCQLVELQRCPDAKEIRMFGGYQPRQDVNEANSNIQVLESEFRSPNTNIEENFQTTDLQPTPVTQPEVPAVQKPHFKSVKVYLTTDKCLSEVCRICFCTIQGDNMVKLYKDTEETPHDIEKIKDMMREVLPGLDLHIYENSVICAKCKDSVIASFELKVAWLATEKKLQKIIENEIKNQNKTNASIVLVAGTAKNKKIKPVTHGDHDYTSRNVSSVKTYSKKKFQETNRPNSDLLDTVIQEVKEHMNYPKQKKPIDMNFPLNTQNNTFPEVYMNTPIQTNALIDMNFPLIDPQMSNFPGGHSQEKIVFTETAKKEKILDKGPFLCELCGQVLRGKGGLKKHLLRHEMKLEKQDEEQRQAMCESCGEICNNVPELKKHIQRKHKRYVKKPQEIIQYQCEICSKILLNKTSLQTHIRHIHFRSYNYVQCHLCGKQLTSKGALNAHLRIHTAQKRYSCEICGKKFFWLPALKKHLLRHSDSKVECEVCGKTVKYESTLKQHIKIFHMKEGKTNCEFCGKPYWKKYDLIRHKIKIHGWRSEAERTTEQG